MTEAALARLTVAGLLDELLERISTALSVDTAALLLLEGDELYVRGARGLEGEVEQGLAIPLGRGFAGRIAEERRPIALDTVDASTVLSPVLQESGIRSLLGVPLLVEGRTIGVLHVGTLHERRFSADDSELLQLVADRAALVLEQSRLYEAERQARQEAEQALRARDEFLSIAAHELNTPITSVRASAQLLLRARGGGRALPEEILERGLTTIDQQSEKLTRLVRQLLDASRLESGRLVLDREPTDLVPLVTRIVTAARQRDDQHPIELETPPSLPVSIDPLRLDQVLTNLLDNAGKFSPAGTSIRVEVSEPNPASVQITVTDRGIGIRPEVQSQIFKRFFQVPGAGRGSGLGLGLYLSCQIVELHGGSLDVESPTEGGSWFIVTLPRAESKP